MKKEQHNICKECGVTRYEARREGCLRWDSEQGEWYWSDPHIWMY